MGRPKGSKNKSKQDVIIERGNPEFNLNSAEPSNTIGQEVASAAYTDEDAELDRELEKMAREQEPQVAIDPEPQPMRKLKENYELLRDHVEDYKPASTVNELEDQVHLAKEYGCDSIEATPKLVRHYNRKDYPEKVGYFIFRNIKVYIDGHFAEAMKRDKITMEEKLFGHSKVK